MSSNPMISIISRCFFYQLIFFLGYGSHLKISICLVILYWMLDFACLIQNPTWLKEMQIIPSSVWTLGFIQFIILWELSCLDSWSYILCRYSSVNSQRLHRISRSADFLSSFYFIVTSLYYSVLQISAASDSNNSCLVSSSWRIAQFCLCSHFLYCGLQSTSS